MTSPFIMYATAPMSRTPTISRRNREIARERSRRGKPALKHGKHLFTRGAVSAEQLPSPTLFHSGSDIPHELFQASVTGRQPRVHVRKLCFGEHSLHAKGVPSSNMDASVEFALRSIVRRSEATFVDVGATVFNGCASPVSLNCKCV